MVRRMPKRYRGLTARYRWLTVAVIFNALAFGADGEFRIPDWLAPYPGNSSRFNNAATSAASQSYRVAASPAAVLSHYTDQLRNAGVPFGESFNGIGTTIRAATNTTSCVVRLSAADDGSTVLVSCSPNPGSPPACVDVTPSPAPEPAKSAPPKDSPAADPSDSVRVVYEVTGTAKKVEVQFRNAAGRTELTTAALPFSKSLQGKAGSAVYLSAENMDRDGNIHVAIRVRGTVVYQASTEQPFGIVTVSGRITN